MKRLLIVDPDFLRSSPSMKGVLRSLPELRSAGFEIEVWCWEIDADLAVEYLTRLPKFGARRLKMLQAIVFSIQVMLLYLWRFQICGQRRPEIVYSIAPYLPQCDVAHAHFSPWDWVACMERMGRESARDWLEYGAWRLLRPWYEFFLTITTARRIIVPSRAVAADYRRAAPGRDVIVLPNSYDPARFHPGVRSQRREEVRTRLGYAPEHAVFIFISLGHHRRKGFFIATAALAKLRVKHPQSRFLVVGGQPGTLAGLQHSLDQRHPDWREWLHFTGMVNDSESYLAAADAFLYPSWSEALALVEIEAAACGLPVFLTPHHGSEMVLEEGLNGRTLSFDPDEIAAVLADFVSGAWKPTPCPLRHALDASAYAREFTTLLSQT